MITFSNVSSKRGGDKNLNTREAEQVRRKLTRKADQDILPV